VAVANPERQDTWLVTCVLEGKDLGIFDKKSGGEVDSDENKYPLGGMLGEISLGGRKTIGELTISRYYDADRDDPLFGFLNAQVGAGVATVGVVPLDFHGNPQGGPVVYSCTLRTFTPPEVDNESQDAAMLELVFTAYAVVP
jgi:hypothetical protein